MSKLLSNDGLKAEDVVKEFEIEELEDYYQRSVRTRGGPLDVKRR